MNPDRNLDVNVKPQSDLTANATSPRVAYNELCSTIS
jgi:hypothetical protein